MPERKTNNTFRLLGATNTYTIKVSEAFATYEKLYIEILPKLESADKQQIEIKLQRRLQDDYKGLVSSLRIDLAINRVIANS